MVDSATEGVSHKDTIEPVSELYWSGGSPISHGVLDMKSEAVPATLVYHTRIRWMVDSATDDVSHKDTMNQ